MHSNGPRTADYRADIDGLRAVAVISVVAFHLNSAWAPGGYVGVDIFFVISGYLITGILWRALDDKRFSFADFYLRRIRRILPAFFAMTAVTLVAGAWLLLPADLEMLARSARYAVFSAANIFYRRHLDTSYFAASSDEQPLLHTWSLGVEEQFYLLWPALLVLITMAGRRRFALALSVACAVAIVSFWISETTLASDPKFAYFMLPSRAGELMLGAIIALALKGREPAPRRHGTHWFHEALAIAGFALIGYSILCFNGATPFPGLHALPPSAGAALLILSGSRSRLAQTLLAPRAMVFIGLISYSLYLWHWPVLAYLRYFHGELSPVQLGVALAAILTLAVLSYRYIERPARHANASASAWRQAGRFALLPMLILGSFSVVLIRTDGLATLRDPSRTQALEDTAPAYMYPENCQQQAFDPTILEQARCVSPAGTTAEVVLWGDSHAAHYLGTMMVISADERVALRNASLSACPPVFGGHYGSEQFGKGCDAFRDLMRRHLLSGAVRVAFLGGNWGSYDTPQFRSDLDMTVQTLRAGGVRVVLLEEVPAFPGYSRRCESRWSALPGANPCSPATPDILGSSNEYVRAMARQQGASFLGVRSALCREGWCSSRLNGQSVYFDPGHLSMAGSRAIGAYLLGAGQADEWRHALTPAGPTQEASTATATSALSH